MKLRSQIMFADIEKETVGLPVGENADGFSGLVKVNSTGRYIMELLQQDMTEDELTARMLEKYNVDEAQAREGVRRVVGILDGAGLIEK